MRTSMVMSPDGLGIFVQRPIAATLLVICLAMGLMIAFRSGRRVSTIPSETASL